MIRSDLTDVCILEIENQQSPWTESDFVHQLAKRNSIGMVVTVEDVVCGFVVYELNGNEMQIVRFHLHFTPAWLFAAEAMVEKLKGKIEQQRRDTLRLFIRETNLPAQLFFKSMGFRATGVLRNYYEDTAEDAIAFVYELPSPDLAKRG